MRTLVFAYKPRPKPLPYILAIRDGCAADLQVISMRVSRAGFKPCLLTAVVETQIRLA